MFPLLIPIATTLVPLIAKWIEGDNTGTTAQAVSDIITNVTGTEDAAVAAKLVADNPQIAADLKTKLLELHIKNEADERATQLAEIQASLVDVQNARARDVSIQTSGKRNVRADIMLVAVVACLLACVIAMVIPGVASGAAANMISLIVGTMLGCFKDVFGFEFGSSRSSETKTGIIENLAMNTVPASSVVSTAIGEAKITSGTWADITKYIGPKP